jgi:hypothetical protein
VALLAGGSTSSARCSRRNGRCIATPGSSSPAWRRSRALFAVLVLGLRWAELSIVTLAWIVMLQVGVLVFDTVRYGTTIRPAGWVAIALIVLLQGYLVLGATESAGAPTRRVSRARRALRRSRARRRSHPPAGCAPRCPARRAPRSPARPARGSGPSSSLSPNASAKSLRKPDATLTFSMPSAPQKRPIAKGRSCDTQSTVVPSRSAGLLVERADAWWRTWGCRCSLGRC